MLHDGKGDYRQDLKRLTWSLFTDKFGLHRPFADAVRAGVGSVMCSYNKINNTYSCENSYVINHLLKNELGFQGFGKWYISFISIHYRAECVEYRVSGNGNWI